MKPKTKTMALTTLICLFVLPSAFAAKDNASFLNGKPFSYLSAAIAENQANIEALKSSVSNLSGELESVKGDIAALGLRVENNTNDIAALFENDVMLSAELNALKVQHEQDIATINAEIGLVEDRISTLKSEMERALAEAKAEIDALSATHDADVSALLTEVTVLLVQIADIRNGMDSQTAQLSQLVAESQQLSDQVAGLQLRVDVLDGRVDTLEGYHTPIPEQCDEGNDSHTNSAWVVCEADASEAWISANNGGTYHPEEICQELGYRTVGSWDGTCGNVCGYCQAATSCSSHGTKRLNRVWDGIGNIGVDDFGGRIAHTVSWSCIN